MEAPRARPALSSQEQEVGWKLSQVLDASLPGSVAPAVPDTALSVISSHLCYLILVDPQFFP